LTLTQDQLISQFYIEIDGADLSAEMEADLLSITVENSLHLCGVTNLVLHDPHLTWIDDDRLEPGHTIKVGARSAALVMGEKPLFDGEIVEVEPDFVTSTPRIHIRAFDKTHRLSRGQKIRVFQDMTDEDILCQIVGEYGLGCQVGPAGSLYHEYILQANRTDLQFVRERAAALGYLAYLDDNTLVIDAPNPAEGVVELQWGETLQEFRPRLTTMNQVVHFSARGWDPVAKQAVEGVAESGPADRPTAPHVKEQRSGGEVAQQAFHIKAERLITEVPFATEEAAHNYAEGLAEEQAGRFIQAEGRAKGNPALVAGAVVNVTAVGERFGGQYFVTATRHHYEPSLGYSTEFSVSGQRAGGFLAQIALDNPRPTPVSGVVIGVVTDNLDPKDRGRVKVRFPWFSKDITTDWIRIATPGGGKSRGLCYLPAIDDEVLIAFDRGDMNEPYVLGGLWNGKDLPPVPNSDIVDQHKVTEWMIRSSKGHRITLYEEHPLKDQSEVSDIPQSAGGPSDRQTAIAIQDYRNNKIYIDTNTDVIVVKAHKIVKIKSEKDILGEADNDIEIDAKGNITVKAKGDITIKADGNITIEAQKNLDLKAGQALSIKAPSIEIKADESAELNAGETTVIKGGEVFIN
jgi:uncharacterized protein involved in type VI secretion and phage assembly